MFAKYFNFLPTIIKSLSDFFIISFTPLDDVISSYNNPVVDFFYSLVTFVGLGDFLSDINIFGICFGSTLVIVLIVSLIKWFI